MSNATDFTAWLDGKGISAPDRGAKDEVLKEYLSQLKDLSKYSDYEKFANEVHQEIRRATRNLKQRNWMNKHKGQTITPKLTSREVAVLDWIGLQIDLKTSKEEGKKLKGDGRLAASRSGALRELINSFYERMSIEIGDNFIKEVADLEEKSEDMKNFWRAYASYKNNKMDAPSPPEKIRDFKSLAAR